MYDAKLKVTHRDLHLTFNLIDRPSTSPTGIEKHTGSHIEIHQDEFDLATEPHNSLCRVEIGVNLALIRD
jgi:hypothetical protein